MESGKFWFVGELFCPLSHGLCRDSSPRGRARAFRQICRSFLPHPLGVVRRAANQNKLIAGGNHTLETVAARRADGEGNNTKIYRANKPIEIPEGTTMLHIYPDFYHKFRCIAENCPDSCCTGWAVVVDEESQNRFRQIPGELGQALRDAMTVDEDGDTIFKRQADGRCPFWTKDGLCRIQQELGEDAPCETCRKFPRLTQDYGSFIEYGLTLSCPVAAELILKHEGPWEMISYEDGEPGEETNLNELFLEDLRRVREELLDELWQEDVPEGEALGRLLAHGLCYEEGVDLDPGEGESLFCEDFPFALIPEQAQQAIRALLQAHLDLEILTPQWKCLLEEAISWEGELPSPGHTGFARNLATDHLYHHWLRAVNDGDCVTRLKLLAVNWLVVRTLAQVHMARHGAISQEDWLALLRLYAKEVGHDEVDLSALEDFLWQQEEELSPVVLAVLLTME